MDRGSELSKTVATFIIQRIILDSKGLDYVCNTAERFHAVNSVLGNMLSSSPSVRLLKHIIRCYSRMAENHRARSILKENFPQILNEKSFMDTLDEGSKKWLINFLKSLGISSQKNQTDKIGYNLLLQNNINAQSNINSTFNFQNNFEFDFQNQNFEKK